MKKNGKAKLSNKLYGKLPKEIKIFDTIYSVEHCDSPSEVDRNKRDSLFGQIDYWTREIRIYHNGRSESDLWQCLWHEIMHGICEKLKFDDLRKDENKIDLLAMGINSVIIANFTNGIVPKTKGA